MGRNNVQVQGETSELPGGSPTDGSDLSDG
jgi:hypothetical protein